MYSPIFLVMCNGGVSGMGGGGVCEVVLSLNVSAFHKRPWVFRSLFYSSCILPCIVNKAFSVSLLSFFFFFYRNDQVETFNVIVMYMSDLGHKKELLGRVQCTAKYGCPHCKKSWPNWSSMAGPAAPISMTEMVKIGKKRRRESWEWIPTRTPLL